MRCSGLVRGKSSELLGRLSAEFRSGGTTFRRGARIHWYTKKIYSTYYTTSLLRVAQRMERLCMLLCGSSRATILEIHRRSTMPRKTYKETGFRGFLIPKDTLVLVNIYSSQMDPETWGDPENFTPERFLDREGNIVNDHKLLTFSIGKRNCIGEAAAETSIFSFLVGIIQNHKLLPVSANHKYEINPVLGVGLSPQPYEIRVERRKNG